MGAKAQCLEVTIFNRGEATGKLIIRVEASSDPSEVIDLDAVWKQMNRRLGWLCFAEVSPIFMRISKPRNKKYVIGARLDESWKYRKETQAYFPRETIPLRAICDNDKD